MRGMNRMQHYVASLLIPHLEIIYVSVCLRDDSCVQFLQGSYHKTEVRVVGVSDACIAITECEPQP